MHTKKIREDQDEEQQENLIAIAVVILIIAVLGILSIYVDKIPSPSTYATFWALVPSVVAITLALITKEVYSSLFIGIVIGSVFASGFSLRAVYRMYCRMD